MMIKFATRGDVTLFDHLDLGIRQSWAAIDLSKCSPEQIEALRKYRGHIIQVHPEDEGAFEDLTAPLPIVTPDPAGDEAKAKAKAKAK